MHHEGDHMKESTKTKKAAQSADEDVASVAKETVAIISEKPSQTVAKSGKRSVKSIKIEEEKQEKEERKQKSSEKSENADKQTATISKPTRTRLERRSKGYRKTSALIDFQKLYSINEAVELLLKTSHVKFDATAELHINLGVDPRQADQNIRQTVVLPSGTGKSIRVAVFADTADVEIAKKAGADIAGNDEFLQQLDKGVLDFDILIATPAMMSKLGKYAKILGPKGLMPNPKSGTVTTNIAKAVNDSKTGQVEYRVDSTGIIHIGIGKLSFGTEKIVANLSAVVNSIKASKPAGLKSVYIKSIFLTSSMGPSIKLELL